MSKNIIYPKSMKFTFIKPKGFTLIELLVVIAVISLLASVVLVALNATRVKARDAKRIADMSQLAKALEIYYDKKGYYPDVPAGGAGCWGGWQSGNVINGSAVQFLQSLVDEGIVSKTPLETKWKVGDLPWTSFDWAACTYRYVNHINFSSVCGSEWNDLAALYTVLENPPPGSSGRAPSCAEGIWGEGGPGDVAGNRGYLLLFKD